MTEDVKQSQEATTELGALLRTQREQLGMSPEEAAAGLNLRPGIIEALEADRHDLLPPRTFVRGYLRTYAKLLGLKEHDVLAAFERQHPEPEAERVRAALSRDGRQRQGGWLKWLVLLIALALIAYVAYQKFVLQEANPEPTAAVSEQPREGVEVAVQEESDEVVEQSASEAAEALPIITPEPTSQEEQSAPALEQTPPEQNHAATEPVEPTATSAAVVAQTAPQAPAAPQAMRTTVSIEVDEESWVEVSDASGAQLHAGLVQGPRTLELSGRPPLRLVIGNAQNARLYYAGDAVPLAAYTRREVARLTLPVAQ